VLGLALAYACAPRLGAWLVPARLSAATRDVVWPATQLLHQFTTYLAALALAWLGAAVFAVLSRAAARFAHGPAIFAAAGALAALAIGFSISRFTGALAGLLLFSIAALVAPALHERVEPRRVPGLTAAFVLGSALSALAWGVWLVAFPNTRLVLGGLALLAAVVAARVHRLARSGKLVPEVEREAAAAAPLLFLPLLGLLRAPGAGPLVAALAASVLLRVSLRKYAAGRICARLAASLAPLALLALLFLPTQFRDLQSINNYHHEAQFYGWLASALRGKWMMADASLFYGPLRLYTMVGWLRVAGVTLEQVRVAAVITNLAGTALLLALAYRLARGRIALVLLMGLLLLVESPIRYFVAYRIHTSFGWADILRIASNLGLLIVLDFNLRRMAPLRRIARRDALVLSVFGALNALTLLYSQEFGLCALAATSLALALDGVIAPRDSRLRDRLAPALRRSFAYLAGFSAMFTLWLAVYAVAGKAFALVQSLFLSVALPGSGAFGSLELPIERASFQSFQTLSPLLTRAPAPEPLQPQPIEFLYPPLIYVVAGAVLIARIAHGRWDSRARCQLGLLLFGVAAYRFASARADAFHLSMAVTPALLLLISLLADALPTRLRAARLRIPAAGLVALLVTYAITQGYGAKKLLVPRLLATLRGEEGPSRGAPYRYPTLKRAGDINISTSVVEAAEYIRSTTRSGDYVYNRAAHMDGGDLMFLANRRNPTRFDMPAELTWRPQQRELLADLRKNPPVLVLGDSLGAPYLDAETIAYLAAGWQPVRTFGDLTIMKRKDAP
jgi:hypothetical protein